MSAESRSIVERAARDLVRLLATSPDPPSLRVADAEGRVACLIQVWDSAQTMPTAGAERRRRSSGKRSDCKRDIVEVLVAAGRGMTRKEVVRRLRLAGKNYSEGTVAKALADSTASGDLINSKDKKGYRLPEWRPRKTPSLFE